MSNAEIQLERVGQDFIDDVNELDTDVEAQVGNTFDVGKNAGNPSSVVLRGPSEKKIAKVVCKHDLVTLWLQRRLVERLDAAEFGSEKPEWYPEKIKFNKKEPTIPDQFQ